MYFKDPEFKTMPDSIYVRGDMTEIQRQTLEKKIRSAKWFRPRQIAPDINMLGFNVAKQPDEDDELTEE